MPEYSVHLREIWDIAYKITAENEEDAISLVTCGCGTEVYRDWVDIDKNVDIEVEEIPPHNFGQAGIIIDLPTEEDIPDADF